jgi:adenine/guanine phosphoribosyltransferase-like PRPP-binding protein
LIDFRYHLVSIVAVFLALAIGIVVGAQALAPAATNALNNASANEARQIRSLYAHNSQLKDQIAAQEALAQAAEPTLLHGLLTGQHVVLVLAPGADGPTVDGITNALQKAGATVTGQVVLTSQFFDTGSVNEQQLMTTATSLKPTGISLPNSQADPQINGQQAAAQVIAATIANNQGVPTLSDAQTRQIMTGFANAGFLQINAPGGGSSLIGQATMAVVVVPGTVPPTKTSGPFNLALISLAQNLQETSKGAVLTGPLVGTGPGSAIDAVTSGAAGVTLTTVDNADMVSGQIIVVQALNELLEPHATPAAYGVRQQNVPSPAPSASPSPSPTPSHSTRKKH